MQGLDTRRRSFQKSASFPLTADQKKTKKKKLKWKTKRKAKKKKDNEKKQGKTRDGEDE